MKKRKRKPEVLLGQEGLKLGASIEVEIERILPGGRGLAHTSGQTVFVMLAAPGDRLRVRIERVQGKIAFGSIREIMEASPVRIEPPCPYFGRCGGCDFQQLNYEAQLTAKVEMIRDCLHRIARLEPPDHIHITPAPVTWRYRSRARWQYDARRRQLGYYELGSHRICDIAECPVILPELQETLTSLRQEMRAHSLPDGVGEFQAVAGDDGVSLVPPVWEDAARERVRTIDGERYRFNADCFFQINHALLEPLVQETLKNASGETCMDLYCGVGLFTVPLARRFTRVIGVEGNPASSEYARRNLADASLTNASVETAAVGDWMQKHAKAFASVDLILLDPPRSGAEPETISAMVALRPRYITYVSCDPATLARDLRSLIAGGYNFESIMAFDMFPQTHHVETVTHLSL